MDTTQASHASNGLLALLGLLTLQQWAIVIGIVLSIGTFVINWYYRHKTAEHQRTMRDIARGEE